MSLLGIDVYSGNAAATVTANINRPDVSFVIAKASEGQRTSYATWFTPFREQVRKTGRRFGSYHWGWPSQDPVVEAQNYLNVAKPQPGEIMVLDLEQEDGATWAQRVDYTLKWCATVQNATGTKPFVYVNVSWRDGLKANATASQWNSLKQYPLWLANYKTPPTPGTAPQDTEWPMVIHQYSNAWNGSDGDWFGGNFPEWDAYTIRAAEEITMTPEQFATLTGKIDSVSTTVNLLRTQVDTLTVKSIETTSSVNTLKAQVNTSLAQVNTTLSGVSDAAVTRVGSAVKDALAGFSVNLTFPKAV